jgi:hypothetical protein
MADGRTLRTRDDHRIYYDRLVLTERIRTVLFDIHQQQVVNVRSTIQKTGRSTDDDHRHQQQQQQQQQQQSTYEPIIFFYSKPSLTDEVTFIHRLQIPNKNILDKPRC